MSQIEYTITNGATTLTVTRTTLPGWYLFDIWDNNGWIRLGEVSKRWADDHGLQAPILSPCGKQIIMYYSKLPNAKPVVFNI